MPIKIETDEEYHSGEGVSKSGLWELYTKTPFHYRYGVKPERTALEVGKASHIAILEPERLEVSVTRGPVDRRGNKWKEAQDFAAFHKTILLTEGDFDMVMRIRDLAGTCRALDFMRDGDPIIETSAYHVDEETGMLVKTRPDLYNPKHKLLADIKNMADGSAAAFGRDMPRFGYHVQEALYTDVWSKGSGNEVDGFMFIVFEKSDPPMLAVYELDANAVAEGHALYRAALAKYAECFKADEWPGYPDEVQRISIAKPWDYKLTQPEAE
jgi:hypothetical protein